MSDVTIEQIQEYINRNKLSEAELDYGDFKLKVKWDLSIEEKLSFVESVVNESYINAGMPSLTLNHAVFAIKCVQILCTEFPFPVKEINGETVIDSELAYDIIKRLDILNVYQHTVNSNLISELKEDVKNRMDFQTNKLLAYMSNSSANTEAIEAVTSVMIAIEKLLNSAVTELEKNSEKLYKSINNKNISQWLNKLQKAFIELERKNTGNEQKFYIHKNKEESDEE